MQKLFRQFSFPGGVPSHVAPETPGSIHEGGELGYALSHAYGAALDNPDLLVACVIGDGEAETGPLAASWHANKFLDPATDGAVLPILHLNGWKIANPTVLARIGDDELADAAARATGIAPIFVDRRRSRARASGAGGGDGRRVRRHPPVPARGARARQQRARRAGRQSSCARRRAGPGPTEVDGVQVEGHLARAPGAAVGHARESRAPRGARALDAELPAGGAVRRRRPPCRGDPRARPAASRSAWASSPHANGGELLRDLDLPDFRDFAVEVPQPGATTSEATRVLGRYLREVMRRNADARNFRLVGPDETASNRLGAVLEVTSRAWMGERSPLDEGLAPDGRVMEILSEHVCQGWLEGYLLTGRHGLFSCYEAFIHIVDSMFNQHAKWLKVTRGIPWRRPIASLNYLLTSHVWRQDHNGFSHQDPGFIDHVMNKKAEVIRVYLPPDANCLLSVADHCLRSRNYVNVIVAGKQPAPNWLTIEAAADHCARGLGVWDWASCEGDEDPDVVMACAGDVPTLETLAAVEHAPRALPEPPGARRQRRRPHAPAAGGRAPARPLGRRVRRHLHDRQAGDLRLPRLSVADPPPHLPAHESRATSTCAATRRKARRRRRSTW